MYRTVSILLRPQEMMISTTSLVSKLPEGDSDIHVFGFDSHFVLNLHTVMLHSLFNLY